MCKCFFNSYVINRGSGDECQVIVDDVHVLNDGIS